MLESAITALRQATDIDDDVAAIARDGTPLSAAEKQMAVDEKHRLFADSDFVRNWLSGNRAARTRVALIDIIAAAPVADARSA
jgi:hypothetical protein